MVLALRLSRRGRAWRIAAVVLGAWLGQAEAMPAFAGQHAMAMHGQPRLPADFAAFPYVNKDAPKGGRFTIGVIGSFDSLNPYVVRGEAVVGLRTYAYAPLMMRNMDEPFTLYPYIAASVDMPDDRTSVTFYLDPRARFSDGHALGAEDVVFSFELLKTKGWPNQRAHYTKVEKVEAIDARTVRFSFPNAHDRELPLILALLPVLPRHATDPTTFDSATLQKPIAAGPYIVGDVKPGASVTLKRLPDWWAKDLPSVQGHYNFDEVRFEFYRDGNALFEAFKKGLVDVRAEDDPVKWIKDYDFPAVRKGEVVKENIGSALPKPVQAYVFNTRRAPLSDSRVREGLLALFDFEWINTNLFSNAYARTESFFQGSELSSLGLPASDLEKAALDAAGARLPTSLLDGTWRLPISDGSGRDRAMRQVALAKFEEAGFSTVGGRLVETKTGNPFELDVMVQTPQQERLMLAYKKTLDSVGIAMKLRQVDTAQAERRRQSFDYDMTFWNYISSLSPGNEQKIRWGSATADQTGSVNMAGVKDPAVDRLLDMILAARSREELVAATRALDRALLAGSYVIPLYNLPKQQIAHWTRIKLPATPCLCGSLVDTWWSDSTGQEPS